LKPTTWSTLQRERKAARSASGIVPRRIVVAIAPADLEIPERTEGFFFGPTGGGHVVAPEHEPHVPAVAHEVDRPLWA
jgi:hypothetical protein